ncbi:MAG: chitobiase/beta-hexosaminidase C-terminal domain-containing protein [Eubacteriales bacterium]|nr:chitobiase/beta-hexosaminidase C-terminal domain-containing protein [Eubacteriales bacterium]
MRCPRCGAPMKEGQLYCEHCGREIQIVPEFEAELENSIHAAMSDVAEQMGETDRGKEKDGTEPGGRAQDPAGPKKREPGLPSKRAIAVFAAVVLVAATAVLGIVLYRRQTPAWQYEQAAAQIKRQDYVLAAEYLKRAVEMAPDNPTYQNALASCYYAMGELSEAQRISAGVIALDPSNEEAYRRYIAVCEKEGDYAAANALLQQCSDVQIRNLYLDYMANPPDFDVPGGTYHEVQTLRLIANAAGHIYYTTDGTEPDTDSEVYTAPLTLESGEYEIRALFVNRYGVESSVSSQRYFIDIERPGEPQASPASGSYGEPTLITVEVPEGSAVYYTTDKSEPGSSSIKYEEPFWMPAGYSTFRFVTVSAEGVAGEVTERQYTLNLHPILSMEAALNQLLLTLKNAGLVSSLQGSVPNRGGKNVYTYKYALTINSHHYYLYREYYEEKSGTGNATGNDYVVNYMSGECYRAVKQEDKSFKLYTIEPESEAESGQGEAS